MAEIDLSTITEALSDEQPCGPDMDMEFDMDFMNLVAELDGIIPTRYFSFDPGDINFPDYFERISELTERTRDLRLLVPLAKLRILNNNLEGYVDTLDAISRLLNERWDNLHPQPVDFLDLSMGQLATLDDMGNSILPLQHVTLLRLRRTGAFSLRRYQVATGEVSPREDEDVVDAGTMMSELADADDADVDPIMERLTRGRDAVLAIKSACIEHAGIERAPGLERLPEAFADFMAVFEKARGSDEPVIDSAAADGASDAPVAQSSGNMVVQVPTGDVATREDAIEAMYQSEKYFALNEPASPVPVLLREAQSAASKTFPELLGDLLPASAPNAMVKFGTHKWFNVQINVLDHRNPAPDYAADEVQEADPVVAPHDTAAPAAAAPAPAPAPEQAPADDDNSHLPRWENAGLEDEVVTDNDAPIDDGNDAPGDDVGDGGDGGANDDVETLSDGGATDGDADASADPAADVQPSDDVVDDPEQPADSEQSAEQTEDAAADPAPAQDEGVPEDAAAQPPAEAAVEEPPRFEATSRPAAIANLEKVKAYYRIAEPASPVPLILDRAIEMSSKSFMDLIQEMLPSDSLETHEDRGD